MKKWPFKILIKFATRGRKERFFQGMDNIYAMCCQPDYIRVVVTADLDDPEMNNDEVKERMKAYKNAIIMYGVSENKIHACNRDLYELPEDYNDWDIVANYSDDQRWTIYGYDDMIRIDFNNVFPEKLNGYMAYLDPDTHGVLSTLFIAGRAWVDKFKFIYDPQFKSLFCDNLAEDCAKRLGLYHYTGNAIYKHFNPSYNYSDFPPDAMYIEQQKIGWSLDHDLYYKIIGEGIDKYLEKYELEIIP